MSASVFVRNSVLTALLAASSALPATAQSKALPRPEAPTKAKLGPGVHDGGGVWTDAVRLNIEEAVRNLYADYHCYVLIETYDGVPPQAGAVDLSDPSAVDHALNARRNQLLAMADRSNCTFSVILVQSKRGVRYSYNMSWPAFGKEEGPHILHEAVHRLSTKGVPDTLSYLRAAVAGKPPVDAGADSTHHDGGTAFHDGAGFWTSADQVKLQHLASDIMRRYKCKIYIETRPTFPARLARGQDLTDHVIADRIFSAWANPRSAAVSSKDGLNINIFACSEVHLSGLRMNWQTPGRRWTAEEQALANKLNVGVNQRLAGKFAPGMADALAFVRDTLEENRTLVARTPAVSMSPVSNEPHPSPEKITASEKTSKVLQAAEIREKEIMLDGEGSKSFRAAAEEGGLSKDDLAVVVAARGKVPYESLTDFINDQVKEGRKGKDLKDDLLTFIKILQEKK